MSLLKFGVGDPDCPDCKGMGWTDAGGDKDNCPTCEEWGKDWKLAETCEKRATLYTNHVWCNECQRPIVLIHFWARGRVWCSTCAFQCANCGALWLIEARRGDDICPECWELVLAAQQEWQEDQTREVSTSGIY